MQRRLLIALLVTLLVSVGVPGGSTQALAQSTPKAQSGEGRPYEIADSEVWDVPDPVSGRGYQVYVALPPSYAKQPQRRYPVLYVTDADYAFPIIRQLARRLNVEGPQIEEFILVGLSYGKGEDGGVSRQRDYTPTPNGPSTAPANAVHGQARAYQAYLRDQVKPYITARYRTDPARASFLATPMGRCWGHRSCSPSPACSTAMSSAARPSGTTNGMLETRSALCPAASGPDGECLSLCRRLRSLRKGDRRYNQTVDMVADNRALEAALQSRQYPGLKLKSVVLNDEDHLTVAPRGFMQALKYLLPVR